jgi:glycosyltransferase involved in cell wall biosynthesis
VRRAIAGRSGAARQKARVVACSRWVQHELASAGIAADVLYLPTTSTPPADFTRRPTADPTFVYCGRLDVEKGIALLLRAFARLRRFIPAARLRVIGTGPERMNMEALSVSLGLREAVAFLGWLDPPAMERHFEEAWASVVPSLWAEPFGLVAVEAITRGVPVIVSAAGGLGEVVEPGARGLLFPNNDEDALLDRLRAIATGTAFPDHTLTDDTIRTAGAEFGLDRHVRQIRRIFGEVVAAASTAVSARP